MEQQRRTQVHDENVAPQAKVPQYSLTSSYKTQGYQQLGFFYYFDITLHYFPSEQNIQGVFKHFQRKLVLSTPPWNLNGKFHYR